VVNWTVLAQYHPMILSGRPQLKHTTILDLHYSSIPSKARPRVRMHWHDFFWMVAMSSVYRSRIKALINALNMIPAGIQAHRNGCVNFKMNSAALSRPAEKRKSKTERLADQ